MSDKYAGPFFFPLLDSFTYKLCFTSKLNRFN